MDLSSTNNLNEPVRSPLEPTGNEYSSARSLITAFESQSREDSGTPWIPGKQNRELIDLGCYKLQSLWQLVTAATDN